MGRSSSVPFEWEFSPVSIQLLNAGFVPFAEFGGFRLERQNLFTYDIILVGHDANAKHAGNCAPLASRTDWNGSWRAQIRGDGAPITKADSENLRLERLCKAIRRRWQTLQTICDVRRFNVLSRAFSTRGCQSRQWNPTLEGWFIGSNSIVSLTSKSM